MKIGDRVIMSKEKILQFDFFKNKLPNWYTNNIYTICGIEPGMYIDGGRNIILDRKLPNGYDDRVNENYLMNITEQRKYKLLRLKFLND